MYKYELYGRSSALIGLEKLQPEGRKSLKELMLEVGMNPDLLSNPDSFTPYLRACSLLEIASIEWEKPYLGIEFTIATDDSMPTAGSLVLLAKFHKTLRSFMNDALEYWEIHTNGFNVELKEEISPGLSTLIIKNNSFLTPPRQMIQHGAANICKLIRIITNQHEMRPIEVHFMHEKQKADGFEDLAEQAFGCPVHFNRDRNQILFPTEFYDYKIHGALSLFNGILRRLIQIRVDEVGNYSSKAADMVIHAIPNFFGTEFCNFNSVAEMLGIHPKTLQRMLAAENTNFKELLSYVRGEKAKEMLASTELSVELIAHFLAYSGSAPFSFAFRKSTGYSPLEYRKRFKLLY